MHSMFRRLAASSAFVAAAVLPLVQATTIIDFEDQSLFPLYAAGEVFNLSGFSFMPAIDGGTIDFADASNSLAPSGSTGMFYTQANDGELIITHAQGSPFSLDGFSAAYAPTSAASTPNTLLVVYATYMDNTNDFNLFFFADKDGAAFPFTTYNNPAEFSYFTNLKQVEFFSCSLVGNSLCTIAENNGQFALDNIQLTAAVPEASTTAMLALGLLVLGLCSRSRSRSRSLR